MKYFTITVLLIGFYQLSYGQQAPHFSMYMLNKHQANPGYAGFDESLSVTGVYRQQWVGLAGSPEMVHLDLHLPLYIIGGGVGLNIDNEQLGARNSTWLSLSYNYWLDINKTFRLGVGARAGIHQMSIDGTLLRAPDGEYEVGFSHEDPLLPESKITSMSPQFGLGVHFIADKINGGVSMSNITGSVIDFNLTQGSLTYSSDPTVQAYLEYEQELGSYFEVKPSIMFRSDLLQHELHFGALLEYDGRFFAGVTFRGYNMVTTDAIAIIFGGSLNEKLSLAYAFDITLSSLQSVSRGSHEILLNYNLGKPIGKGKLPNIIYNPRF